MKYLADFLLVGMFVLYFSPLAGVRAAESENHTKSLAEGKQLVDYDLQLSSDKATDIAHTWKISDGSLPPGLIFDTATGRISGRPTLGGIYLFSTQLLGNSKDVVEEADWSITVRSGKNIAADFDYDGDVDNDDRRAFVLSYTGSRPEPAAIDLEPIEQPEHVIEATEDVWIREIVPGRVYENDGVSVYSNVPEGTERLGLITFDLATVKGKRCRGAALDLYNIGGWGGYKNAINQTAAIVPGRAAGVNWDSFQANQHPHEQLFDGLRHRLGGSEKGSIYVPSTPAQTAQDLAKIQAAIDGDGVLTLLLRSVEDGSEYWADWGDISRIRQPARLRLFLDGPPCYITTATLSEGRMGIPFSETLSACEACGDSQQWELTAGSLPTGLRLEQATGRISGVPRFGGTYPFRVKLHDQATKATRYADLAITIETRRADFDRDGDGDEADRQVLETAFTGPIDEQAFVYHWRNYVTKCLDTLIEHGQDVYGPVKTPMLMAVIDVRSLTAPENPDLYDSNIRAEGRPGHGRRSPGGSNLWLDMPIIRTMYRLSRITGDGKYANAADAYMKAAMKQSLNSAGMFCWGSHSYYHAYRDERGGDGHHEILVLHPEWADMYRLDPEAVRREVDGIWEWHIIDPETGKSNRHADKGATGAGSFGFSTGSFAIAFTFMHTVTKEDHYLDKAKKVVDWHWIHRNPKTNLVSDTHGPPHPTSAPGTHTSQLLRCYELSGDRYFLDTAITYIKAYEDHGWDEQAQTYWGMLELDGTPLPKQAPGFTLEDPAGYWYPTGHVDIWRATMYPYEFPLVAAQASIYAYELSGRADETPDPALLKTALHWAQVIEKDLPPHTGRRWRKKLIEALPDLKETGGTYAENYGRAISFYVHLYRATGSDKYLALAKSLAREAVSKLYENGLFKGHPAKPYYESNDGVGILLYALLELDTPLEDLGGNF